MKFADRENPFLERWDAALYREKGTSWPNEVTGNAR